jgi:PD-(D/E)XK nuclease superfamily
MEIEFQEVLRIIETNKPRKSQVEKFNIFSILHKENEEKRLHSRFIAALLDPEGSHGMRYKFLYTFLELNGLNYEDFGNASVYPNEVSKKELNFIDILIIDEQSKKAIIIENKINAGDSNNEEGGQLERYFKHVRDDRGIEHEDIKTYYLTPNKREPSAESLGEFKELSKINGECISYPDEINKWLKKCL